MSSKKGLPLQAWLIIGIPVIGVLLVYLTFPASQQDRDHLINMLGTTNHGVLIQPAVDASKVTLRLADGESIRFGEENSRWKLLIADDGNCAKVCQESLYVTRQIHKLIPKRSNRIERLYVAPHLPDAGLAGMLKEEYPALLLVRGDLEAVLGSSNVPVDQAGTYYLMDPRGQIIMYYTAQHDYKKIIKDLKVLL